MKQFILVASVFLGVVACKNESQQSDSKSSLDTSKVNIGTDPNKVYDEVTVIPLEKEGPKIGRQNLDNFRGLYSEATIAGKQMRAKASKSKDGVMLGMEIGVSEGKEMLNSDIPGIPIAMVMEDLNKDEKPEMFLVLQPQEKDQPNKLLVYAQLGSRFIDLDGPQLSPEDQKAYRGGDELTIEDGKLKRTFPLFKEGDADTAPSGGTKTLFYTFDGRYLKLAQ